MLGKVGLLFWIVGLGFPVNCDIVKDEEEVPLIGEEKTFGFMNGFMTTFSVIVVSELGDKTFFIAALMAMKHSRRLVLAGALVALTLMHVGSCLFGYLFAFVPRLYILLVSSGLFAFFGLKLLWEGWRMEKGAEALELKEVSQEIQKQEDQESEIHLESQTSSSFLAPFFQTFTMTFFAEWGDRSQIATIVLGARENLNAVIVGGLLGHFVCSALAVLGGRLLSSRISVKSLTFLGGFIFLLFSCTTLIMNDLEK
ncbi:putative divalent cation/proton antiporter TMEM165 [Lepeophtheirus salmonis]|uniref:putative divalent cation/proton antiporter TMEM165 n=1 Tax=Lepeophtheirus salmonis TaxID=72036 RepID=UPI00077F2A59|nr:transmembrane protein 165-like [Lepeophtheirus salmonis]